MSQGILIVGGGGHAKQVIETLRLTHPDAPLAIVEAKTAVHAIMGVPIAGTDDFMSYATVQGFAFFAMGIGGVGDNRPRAAAFARARAAGLAPQSVVHPSAVIATSARIGAGTQCLPGAIVAAEAVVGEDVLINSGAIVEHDCRLGEHVHVATGAVLTGTVEVEAFAHIGARAVIRQSVVVGQGAIVGLGAVVTENVPPGATVVGVPARPVERA
jgi:UDP-perosamine 4-acetyltransferase